MHFYHVESFDQWRDTARLLLSSQRAPSEVSWSADQQPLLFDSDAPLVEPASVASLIRVPKEFLELAKTVACHRDRDRWELLYRTLWRLTHDEPHLLEIVTDDDVHRLVHMRKAITRDVHKMKAFVRFRKVQPDGDNADSSNPENYVAWHRPDHRIVRLAAPFFARRFKAMNWSILTPDESVCWDQSQLTYGDGVPVSEAPDEDALEELWKTYYASIFNPARIKVDTMKREMPVRHWPTLPETALIPQLLESAGGRVDEMIKTQEGFDTTATQFLPDDRSLDALAKAAECCRACDLHQHATQTVFGVGSENARIVIVGEQPGDREDIEGRPFVGPAGQLLDEALQQAGIDRDQVYITNVVKHFKFTEQETTRGKRRLHKKPNSREIFACRPWLEAELAVTRPQALVCLGATAAQALFGRDFRITKQRGQPLATDWCTRTVATWHPAAILRMPDQQRREQMQWQLVNDLTIATAS
ncbi:MAG: UdgX family uracil-DNA binding protein [Pirellulaceae bacterium]|nr:UdgX family uracil-DNA binding protein [Pirellulaceae bacterium]